MKTDIIIPIYNAYEYLVECVNSIYRYTSMDDFNLYLIDDCSPDERIKPYIESVEKKYKNVIIHSNENNFGFVRTVNVGMMNSKHNVILLNSDTEVTENWLNQMLEAANHDTMIATVTCLTNSGVICSIPNFCEDNELPGNYPKANDFAKFVHKYASYLYPEAPTGVGFCMFIKRDVINEIGYFDEEHFGKGYGEENDFCCRCVELGYKNIIDDATFIFHKGSMSFNEDKAALCKKNSEVLGELYPYYFSDVANFVQKNPLQSTHKVINLMLQIKKAKNVLYLLHNDFHSGRNHPIGGTELHVSDLCKGLNDVYNCFVLTSHKDNLYLDIYSNSYVDTLVFPMPSPIRIVDVHSSAYEKAIYNIINFFDISLIHIHHLKGHTMDIFNIAEKQNIPILYTMHDFYSLCPSINLLYDNTIYCRFLRNNDNCNICLKKSTGFNCIAETWRERFSQIFDKSTAIITPSMAVKDITLEFFNQFDITIKDKFHVIEHGRFHTDTILNKSDQLNEKFTICIFGGVSMHKGSELIKPLLKSISHDVEWHILGNIYDDLALYDQENVTLYGPYKQNDILNKLYDINPDIVLATPICPETFSYILSEAFMADIPVLGTNLGALSSRIINDENGWLLPFPLDISFIIHKINDLKENRQQIIHVKNKLALKKNHTIKNMVREYQSLYTGVLQNIAFKHTKEMNVFMSNIICAEPMKVEPEIVIQNDIDMNDFVEKKEYDALIHHIEEIHNSSSWKLLRKINTFIDKLKRLFKGNR